MRKLLGLPYSFIYPLITYLSKKLDRYIAVSDYVKQEYVKRGFNPYKINVIPNSIDTDGFKNTCKVVHDDINILYVGRMDEAKGVSILIDAFKEISKSYDDTRFILVGDGPLLNRYRMQTKENSMENKIMFTGHQRYETIDRYYSVTDIFVHPTVVHEPFGLTLLEAMGYEIPILVSDVGSLKNMVKDAGIPFNKGDVKDLASKLAFLVENKGEMTAISNKSKANLRYYDEQRAFKQVH
jgi:glycosyltransferase involved in cell wall biosynthesis